MKKIKPILLTSLGTIVFIFILGLVASNLDNGPVSVKSSSNDSANSIDDFAIQISNKTGESTSNIRNALAIVERYDLGDATKKIIVENAAMIAAMTSSGKNSDKLKFLGFGGAVEMSDSFAQIAHSWKLTDSTAQHNFDVLLNMATQSTIKWPEFSSVLISNGPKFNNPENFADAVATLSVMSKLLSADSAVEIFNRVGDAAANPNDKLNVALGGKGYIRSIIKKDGISKAVEITLNYIKQNAN